MFRSLTEEEKKEFRTWARENHKPGDKIEMFWHPVVQDECVKIDEEVDREAQNTIKIKRLREEWYSLSEGQQDTLLSILEEKGLLAF
jgi:hypothetical protein